MLSPDPSPGKTIPTTSAFFALQRWSVLSCAGPDAAAFLQAQTMNDVRGLTPGAWQWNGWLTAKGRVVALFVLLRVREDAFMLIVPDLPATELGAELQRFVFRSKLRLEALPEGCVFGQFDQPAPAGRAELALETGDGSWTLNLGTPDQPRHLRVIPRGISVQVSADSSDPPNGDSDAGSLRWLIEDLRFGLPRLSGAQRATWTPQMLSLQRLRAFSLSKGCYPGQEIVARTHYLGKAKRSLRLLSGAGLHDGGEVRAEDGALLGSILCSDASGSLALAVLASDAGSAALVVAGGQARELPLRDGLQRPV
ncbi:MAG: folate-binding protein [Pseudoxanthomonas sp.]